MRLVLSLCLLLAGCADWSVFEFEAQFFANTEDQGKYGVVQIRPYRDGIFESDWAVQSQDLPGVALVAGSSFVANNRLSVVADQPAGDLAVKMRLCTSVLCTGSSDGDTRSMNVRLERPMYPGRTTWLTMDASDLGGTAAPGEPELTYFIIGRCRIRGCVGGDLQPREDPDGFVDYCAPDGRHFCEIQ